MQIVRADKSYLLYLQFWLWVYAAGLLPGIIVLSIVGVMAFSPIIELVLFPIIIILLANLLVMVLVTRISFDLRWYIITDTSITVRQGAWTIREITVSYQNIQNVSVSQGPLERYFGFANLQIDTAGSGGAHAHGKGENPNRAVLRGIINAPQIRDTILDNLRTFRNSGLGDPDDVAEHAPMDVSSRLTILKEIAEETTALRQVASRYVD
ncbi:MAG: PH domain-containing protein [Ignavibacteria bacterium]|nr:PH domain-containing protein [Ignavibacteria bacterium]